MKLQGKIRNTVTQETRDVEVERGDYTAAHLAIAAQVGEDEQLLWLKGGQD